MTEFLSVAAAHFLALLSPGPDFFIIVSLALRNGSGRAVLTCIGIALANGVYIVFAIVGFSVLRDHLWLLNTMKIAGACFLCYMGFMLIRSSKKSLFAKGDVSEQMDSNLRLFMSGFMSAILNPKNPIFYLSLYSLFISSTTGLKFQMVYGVWMFSVVLFWDMFVAYSIGSSRVKNMLNAYIYRIEQLSGLAIIALGVTIGLY